jgi:hypothetical protein
MKVMWRNFGYGFMCVYQTERTVFIMPLFLCKRVKGGILKPYVGITGFMSRGQVETVLELLELVGWPETHLLMVGVLVSPKSLRQEELKPIWRNKYPDPEHLRSIFVPDPRALNLVHYNTKEPGLADQLEQVTEMVPNLDGFQLNIVWPDSEELALFRERHPDLKIVLQLSRKALLGYDPESVDSSRWLHDRLKPYAEIVDYVLLDLSCGLGVQLNPQYAGSVFGGLLGYSDLRFREVVAGGLDGAVLADLVDPLLELVPWLSWDAEGRLRTKDDELDFAKCADYLAASSRMVKRYASWYEEEFGRKPKFSY